MIEKKLRLINLFDFYGELLTAKSKDVLTLYCMDDLSLGEIAEELSISRQGVYDAVKRSEKTLEKYDAQLKLLDRFNASQAGIKEMIHLIDEMDDDHHDQRLVQLKTIATSLLE